MPNQGIFELNKESFKSALVSTILMAIVAMAGYVIGLGDVFKVEYQPLINIGVMSILTGLVSLIKNYLTSDNGKFAGAIKIE